MYFVKYLWVLLFSISVFGANLLDTNPPPNKSVTTSDSVEGLYKSLLIHEATKYYQFANITLKTFKVAGKPLKVSANIRVFFGDANSTEFLTYEYDDCSLDPLTRRINIKSEKNDISFVGVLKSGTFEGEWFSTLMGRVGKFQSNKTDYAKAPTDGILIKSLTGTYKGSIENTNKDSNLPERATISLVTTQDTTSSGEPVLKVTGSMRLYIGEFGSIEYEETKLSDVQFNFYNRYFTAKTVDYGITLKGTVSHEGLLKGIVFADGIGEAGKIELKKL